MSNIPALGSETEKLLLIKFMQIEHLDSQQCEYGKFGFVDPKVNSDWHTFRSGAINMLSIQLELVSK